MGKDYNEENPKNILASDDSRKKDILTSHNLEKIFY